MDWILIVVLAALLVFMFWNSRRRMQKAKAEQEEKSRQTVPGARVLLQGGLYGTIVSFDGENLDAPAEVELAPGVVVEVHSQAVLRVVDPTEGVVSDEEYIESEASRMEYVEGVDSHMISPIPDIERIPADSETEKKDKPEA